MSTTTITASHTLVHSPHAGSSKSTESKKSHSNFNSLNNTPTHPQHQHHQYHHQHQPHHAPRPPPSPLFLPTAIWVQIASYLPASTVQKLVGLNAAFFELAMELKYRQVSFAYLDERMVRMVDRLRDPAISRRVRIVHIYPGFLKQVHDRTRKRAKSPFGSARKYALGLLDRISGVFSGNPQHQHHSNTNMGSPEAHISTSPPAATTMKTTTTRRRPRSQSHASLGTSAFSFASSRPPALPSSTSASTSTSTSPPNSNSTSKSNSKSNSPSNNTTQTTRPLSLTNTDELLRVLLEVLKSLEGVTDYYVTWPDHALRLATEREEGYGYGGDYGVGNEYHRRGKESGKERRGEQSHFHSCLHHHTHSHHHSTFTAHHANANAGANIPLSPTSAVPFLTELLSCRNLRKLSLDISVGNVREFVGGEGFRIGGGEWNEGKNAGALAEMFNLEELDLCLHVPASTTWMIGGEGCCARSGLGGFVNPWSVSGEDDELGIFGGVGIGKNVDGGGRERRGSEPVIRSDYGSRGETVVRLGGDETIKVGLRKGALRSSSNLREIKDLQAIEDLSFVSLGVPGMMYVPSSKSKRKNAGLSSVLDVSASSGVGSPRKGVEVVSPASMTLSLPVSPFAHHTPLSPAQVYSPLSPSPHHTPLSPPNHQTPYHHHHHHHCCCETTPLSPLVTHLLPALSSPNVQRSLKVLGLQVQMQGGDGPWSGGLSGTCLCPPTGACDACVESGGISASSSCSSIVSALTPRVESLSASVTTSFEPGLDVPCSGSSCGSRSNSHLHTNHSNPHLHANHSNASPRSSHMHAHNHNYSPQHALTPLLSSLHLPALHTLTLNIPIEAPELQFASARSLAGFLGRHKATLREMRMRGREGGGGMRGESERQRGQGRNRKEGGGGWRGSWRTSMVDPGGLFDMGMGEGIVEVEGMEGLVGVVVGDEVGGGEREVEQNEKGGDEGAFDKWMREVMRELEGGVDGDVSDVLNGDVGEGRSTNQAHLTSEETLKTIKRTLPLPNLTTLDISSALFPVSTALVVVETLTSGGRRVEEATAFERGQNKLETLSLTGCYWMQDDVERVLDCVAQTKESKAEVTEALPTGLKTLRMSLHTLTTRVLKMLNTRLENPEFVDVGLGDCVGVMSRGMGVDVAGGSRVGSGNGGRGERDDDGRRERCRVELIVKCGDTRGSVGSTISTVTSRVRDRERRVMKNGSGTASTSRVSGRRSASSGSGVGGPGGMMDMSMRETSMSPVSILAAQSSRALRKASKSASTSTSTSTSSSATATAIATGVEMYVR